MNPGAAPADAQPQRRIPVALRSLGEILSPTGFPFGSNGPLFKDGEFGRDSLETAEDLLEIRPDIARTVIRRLAELQGTVVDPRTEEEPGKIHHEHRALVMYGRPIAEQSVQVFRFLARHWHLVANDDELNHLRSLTNYGTVDATPLYVRLVGMYCALHGNAILDEPYTPNRPIAGIDRPTIRDSVRAAVDWIANKVDTSDAGLLEWRRMTPWGHRFQAWKDGATSYLHPDNTCANYLAPMASVEVQGLAYDALVAGPTLLPDASDADRTHWHALTKRLQRETLDRLWMPEQRFFAMGLDRDPYTGAIRQIKLLTSNAGALLYSGILDSLDTEERLQYVEPVVERLFSDEFLTPAGIRCSSLVHRDIPGYCAYQSTYTVWHKETYDIAKGLRRQGLPELGAELERRMLNAMNVTGAFTEFLYVMPDNRVDYEPLNQVQRPGEEIISGTNIPENDQAWSVSAALATKWRVGAHRMHESRPGGVWQNRTQGRLLDRVGRTELLRSRREIEQARRDEPRFRIDVQQGWDLEHQWEQAHDLEPATPE